MTRNKHNSRNSMRPLRGIEGTGVSSRGFTTIELLTVLAVTAIIATSALPSMQSLISNNNAAAASNQMVDALQLARNEAVSRGLPVSVCASSDNVSCVGGTGTTAWQTGWIVFTDNSLVTGNYAGAVDGTDQILKRFQAVKGKGTLTSGSSYVQYLPNGFLNVAAGTTITFSLRTPKCTGSNNRNILVNAQGRPGVAKLDCTGPAS